MASLPRFESDVDVKVVAATSPQHFEELRRKDPGKAAAVLSDAERADVLAFHSVWKGFLYPFPLAANYENRARRPRGA